MLLEIKGEGNEEKAEHLANRIKEIIKEKEGAKIWRPSRRQKIRLSGLPIGVKVEEVASAIAEAGGGDPGRVRVGPLRTGAFGACTAWADCPVSMATRVVEVAGTDGLRLG